MRFARWFLVLVAPDRPAESIVITSGDWPTCHGTASRWRFDCGRAAFSVMRMSVIGAFSRNDCRKRRPSTHDAPSVWNKLYAGWVWHWAVRRVHAPQKDWVLGSAATRCCAIYDAWRWRRAQRYGTILCDLERRRVVDLLPDRQSNTVAEWLRDHAPSPEIISRDRAGAYAEAAHQGAPQAVQVADRFHLLRNLREALEHVLARHTAVIEEAFRQLAPTPLTGSPPTPPDPALTRVQQRSRERRQRRFERYQQVIELSQRGHSGRAIASQLGLNRKTVRYWLRAGQFPERQVTPRRSSVDRWLSYLEQRWEQGCHNRSQLWRELRAQGADFAAVTLRRWFRVRLGVRGHPRQSSLCPPRKRLSPRQTSALLLGLVRNPSPSQQNFAQTLCALSPDIATTVELANQFRRMMRERDASGWLPWRKAARKSSLHHFVVQLQRDEAAVQAALTLPWSTGPVEGHIHRLKLIKRQMYGRAKLDLLRIRVLYAA